MSPEWPKRGGTGRKLRGQLNSSDQPSSNSSANVSRPGSSPVMNAGHQVKCLPFAKPRKWTSRPERSRLSGLTHRILASYGDGWRRALGRNHLAARRPVRRQPLRPLPHEDPCPSRSRYGANDHSGEGGLSGTVVPDLTAIELGPDEHAEIVGSLTLRARCCRTG